MKVGVGFRSCGLINGKKIIIGGVSIPFEKGLDGPFDADILTHSIMDSILDACK